MPEQHDLPTSSGGFQTLPEGVSAEQWMADKLREDGLEEDAVADAMKQMAKAKADMAAGKTPDSNCAPCGDGKAQAPLSNKPPYYALLGEYLHRDECGRIIERARAEGWQKGTIIDGTPSRNSSVRFLSDDWILDRMRQLAVTCGPLLGLDVWPDLLASVQIGRYLPHSEDYGWHVDHDPTRRHVEHDRKLSLVGALSDGGALELDGVGRIALNAGDMLAFGGNVSHMAPPLEHKRYTIVAWIPGPAWR